MTAIDIGLEAINRSSQIAADKTYLAEDNPANADGTIDTVELWFNMTGYNVKVGTFYGSGTDYTMRDYAEIGTVSQGSKQTFTGLNIDVVTGDLIGVFFTSGYIECDGINFGGVLYYSGDAFDGTTHTFSEWSNYGMSLYGTGSTPVVAFMKPIKYW